jgi:hypothetical protein
MVASTFTGDGLIVLGKDVPNPDFEAWKTISDR